MSSSEHLEVESLSEWGADFAIDSPVAAESNQSDDIVQSMARLELTSNETLGTVYDMVQEIRQVGTRLADVQRVSSESGRMIQDIKQSSGKLLDRVSSTHMTDVENPAAMIGRMQQTVQGLENSLEAIKEELKGAKSAQVKAVIELESKVEGIHQTLAKIESSKNLNPPVIQVSAPASKNGGCCLTDSRLKSLEDKVFDKAPNIDTRLSDTQSEQIDKLIYTIWELQLSGKTQISPLDVLQKILGSKQFSSKAGLSYTELIALAVRRGLLLYIHDKRTLHVAAFRYNPKASVGQSDFIPRQTMTSTGR